MSARDHTHLQTMRAGRRRRLATGLNVFTAIALFGLLVAMINWAAFRYLDLRYNFSSLKFFELSEKSRGVLADLDGHLQVTTVFSEGEILGDEVRYLLKEYEIEAGRIPSLTLSIEAVDPDRDLLRIKELADEFDITEPNVVIFQFADRFRVIDSDTIVNYEKLMDYEGITGGQSVIVRKRRIGFRGEEVFTSVIHSLNRESFPAVYFLAGHGERQAEDFQSPTGYGSIARELRRENIEVKSLVLSQEGAIPEDCRALVIAGPRTALAEPEIQQLRNYLERSGRLLLLLDMGNEGGLAPMLADWGVRVGNDFVVARSMSLTGRELMLMEYGAHPVTKPLQGIFSVFYLPRSVTPAVPAGEDRIMRAHEARVTVLASTPADGWAEVDFSQTPPAYDEGIDMPGPVPVAVAVERGTESRIGVELDPTKMVVFGDTDFVSNIALDRAGGGNADFFVSALNWLLERNELLGIPPKDPLNVRFQMDHEQIRLAYILIAGLLPGVFALMGLFVWIRRQR